MADKPIAKPLPADLPEDWQYNQIVAPAGAEVGLSAQHGYNYLMEQVNAVQEAVNAINDAFTNLASLGANGKIPLDQLIIDTALSATSGNPVQNKAVQAAINTINKALEGKAPAGNYAGSSSAGGAANSAVKLQTARSIHVNLGSTSAANFDGSGNANPGIYGILGVGSGGTGANNAAGARANLGINLANLGGCRIVTGTYIGNGAQRTGNTVNALTGGQFINLGATPIFVATYIIYRQTSTSKLNPRYNITAVCASNLKAYLSSVCNTNTNGLEAIDIVTNGFYVGYTDVGVSGHTNAATYYYAYTAFI